MLQKIITSYEKKSWLRVCLLNGIDKWDLIQYLKEPVYNSREMIKEGLEIKTKVCLKCGTKLDLRIYKGTFIIFKTCNCAKDNTHLMTYEKLLTVMSAEQANLALKLVFNERKKGLKNTVEYWIRKGYSLEEAKANIKTIQKERSSKSPTTKKGHKSHSKRTKEYWTKLGLNDFEAIQMVKEVQTTNGLDYYRKKYGNDGEKLFQLRMEKWLNSKGNKDMIANRSKISLKLFEQIGVGLYGNKEKIIRGKQKVHRVDYIYGDKIIEFYGDYWHANPKIYTADSLVRKKKAQDIWNHDRQKVDDLQENGYNVMIVWENEFKTMPNEILQKCRDFIK